MKIKGGEAVKRGSWVDMSPAGSRGVEIATCARMEGTIPLITINTVDATCCSGAMVRNRLADI